MKDLIKEVALSVAHSMQKALPREMQYGVNAEFTVEFATAFLAELSKRAEAVAWHHPDEGLSYSNHYTGNIPLFTFPLIHDIEAIENRVAEACAKLVTPNPDDKTGAYQLGVHLAGAIRNQEWRKYK